MSLNLGALRVFVEVVSSGGFSRAALRLRLSQPAVSKAVITLERQQGLALLERGSHRAQPTAAGAMLYERALELFSVEQTAIEELHAHRTLERGVLRIGASTTIATYLLPSLLGAFRARHPGVQLRVTSANTRDIARAMLRRRVEIGLVEGPVAHERLHISPWQRDELVIIAPPGHELSHAGMPLSPRVLDGEEFVRRERGSGTREVTELSFAEHSIAARFSLTLSSTEAVKQSVAAGLGLAAVSRAAAADQIEFGRVVQLVFQDFRIERELSRLALRGHVPSPAAREFTDFLEKSAADGPRVPAV